MASPTPPICRSRGVTNIGGWTFNPDAEDYSFSIENSLNFNDAGIEINGGSATITNNSSLQFSNTSTAGSAIVINTSAVNFNNTSSAGSATITNNLFLQFSDTSTAGSATITNNLLLDFFGSSRAGSATITNNDTLSFNGTSTAGGATITNNLNLDFFDSSTAGNAAITNNAGGTFDFNDTSSAGSATITNNVGGVLSFHNASTAGSATITNNDILEFRDTSSAGNAQLINNAGGMVDFSASTGPANDGRNSAGSIAGAGDYYLGSNTLTVGGNDLDTTVSGVISDCGASGNDCFDGGATGGALVKTGAGTLTLSGANTYTGATDIDAGALNVTGSLVSTVNVNDGGTLMGTGTIGGLNANGGGTVSPGNNAIGTLNVASNVTFASGSTYEVEVDPGGTDSDLIHATGTATLNGGSVVHIGADGTYAPNATYTILTADGGRIGEFDGVTSNFAFLDPTLSYDPNNVFLELTRNDVDFANFARTRNQRATAQGVESLNMGNAVYDAIVVLGDDAATIQASFDALSGEIHASAKTALIEDSQFVREAVSNRLRAAFGAAGAPAMPVLSYAEGGPQKAPANTDRFAAWGQAFGAWGHGDSDGNAAELERSAGGVFVGADALTAHLWRLGLFAGYSRTSFDADDRASSGDSENYHLGAYGGTAWGALGLRLGATYGWHDIDTDRSIVFPGFAETAKASYDARTAQVFGELGYAMTAGPVALEPFAGVAYVNLRSDGFTESGDAGLLGESGNTDVTFTTLGVHGAISFEQPSGLVATLRGTLGWRHAFGDVTPLSTHAFAGGSAFTIAGVPIAEDAAVIEAGLDVTLSANATVGLAYNGQIASDAEEHGFKADLSVAF